MEQKYIKASEVAEKFGVTRQTIRNWIGKGLLKAVKLDGCHYCTAKSVRAIEDKYSEIVVEEGALEEYLHRLRTMNDQYRDSVEDLKAWSEANLQMKLSKQRLAELIPLLFEIVRVGVNLRGENMLTMMMTGSDSKEIGEKFGVSPERVNQIIEKTILILNYQGTTYQKLKEENVALREELTALNNNVKSLSSFREPGAAGLEYSKVDVQENILTKRLVDCNLSVRALNCLKSYSEKVNGEWVDKDIETVGDLTRLHKTDLLKLRNFGKKCLIELDDFLSELGLEWGTNYMVNENGEVVKVEQK